MIIVNNLCDFYDLYTSHTGTFVMNFKGRKTFIIIVIYYYYYYYYCYHYY